MILKDFRVVAARTVETSLSFCVLALTYGTRHSDTWLIFSKASFAVMLIVILQLNSWFFNQFVLLFKMYTDNTNEKNRVS